MNLQLKCGLFDTFASSIEIYSEIKGSSWLSRLSMPMIRLSSGVLLPSPPLCLFSFSRWSWKSKACYYLLTPSKVSIYSSLFDKFARIMDIERASSTYLVWVISCFLFLVFRFFCLLTELLEWALVLSCSMPRWILFTLKARLLFCALAGLCPYSSSIISSNVLKIYLNMFLSSSLSKNF